MNVFICAQGDLRHSVHQVVVLLLEFELLDDFLRVEPTLTVSAAWVLRQGASLQDVQAFEDWLIK